MDEIRVTPDLTVTVGLRFDYQSAIRERDDNMSTFDPGVPNPGAGGRLGAMIFAGAGPGRTGARTLESPPVDAFGPRIGIAYRVGDRNVVRAAYGIYYSQVPHAQFDSVNTLGFRFHPTANDLSNGRRPAYFLDDGVFGPQSNIVLPPSIDPSIGNNTSPCRGHPGPRDPSAGPAVVAHRAAAGDAHDFGRPLVRGKPGQSPDRGPQGARPCGERECQRDP